MDKDYLQMKQEVLVPLYEAITILLQRMNMVHESPQYKQVWANFSSNGSVTNGPNYSREFNNAVLAARNAEGYLGLRQQVDIATIRASQEQAKAPAAEAPKPKPKQQEAVAAAPSTLGQRVSGDDEGWKDFFEKATT
jgi:hypothetical protein